MNRTQRAVKRACKKSFAYAKRQKRLRLYELKETDWSSYEKRAAALKDAVNNEKSLRPWHRKMVQDCAIKNNSTEERA